MKALASAGCDVSRCRRTEGCLGPSDSLCAPQKRERVGSCRPSCRQVGGYRRRADHDSDNADICGGIERIDTEQQTSKRTSAHCREKQSERKANSDVPCSRPQDQLPDVAPPGAESQTYGEIVLPAGDIQAQKAEQSDGGETEGQRGKQGEHPCAQAPRSDCARDHRIHCRHAIDDGQRVEGADNGTDSGNGRQGIAGRANNDVIGRRGCLCGGVIDVGQHGIDSAIPNV